MFAYNWCAKSSSALEREQYDDDIIPVQSPNSSMSEYPGSLYFRAPHVSQTFPACKWRSQK